MSRRQRRRKSEEQYITQYISSKKFTYRDCVPQGISGPEISYAEYMKQFQKQSTHPATEAKHTSQSAHRKTTARAQRTSRAHLPETPMLTPYATREERMRYTICGTTKAPGIKSTHANITSITLFGAQADYLRLYEKHLAKRHDRDHLAGVETPKTPQR